MSTPTPPHGDTPPTYGRRLKADEAVQGTRWTPTPEGTRQFALFAAWRDLGGERSMRSTEPLADANGGKPPSPRTIQRLAKRYHWRERAEAWDEHVDARRREAKEDLTIEAELDRYRDRQKRLGAQLLEGAIEMAEYARAELKKLRAKKDGEVRPSDVARMFTASVQVAAMAGNAEAQAIGLRELIGVLEDAEQSAMENSQVPNAGPFSQPSATA